MCRHTFSLITDHQNPPEIIKSFILDFVCSVLLEHENFCMYNMTGLIVPTVFVQVSELQRSLKASQTEQQEALERAAAAVTLEQKAIQDSLLQVHYCLFVVLY